MKSVAFATNSQKRTYTLVYNGRTYRWYSGSIALTTIPPFASKDAAIDHVKRLGWEVL